MASQPRFEDKDVHLIIECKCGKKFKQETTYNQIDNKTVSEVRGRVFAHGQNSGAHPTTIPWEEVKNLPVRVWNTEWSKEYKYIRPSSKSRSRSPRRGMSPSTPPTMPREEKLDKVLELLTSVHKRLDKWDKWFEDMS